VYKIVKLKYLLVSERLIFAAWAPKTIGRIDKNLDIFFEIDKHAPEAPKPSVEAL